MKTRLRNFLNEVVDSNLPVELQSQVFTVANLIGGDVAKNSSCSNSTAACDTAINYVDCTNYGLCTYSDNRQTCITRPKPVQGQCLCSGGLV